MISSSPCHLQLFCNPVKYSCPGFSQDRVNFHQELEGNTAGRADPTWPNRIGYSIQCAIRLSSGWGSWAVGRQSQLGSMWRRQSVRVALCVLLRVAPCVLLFCFVYFVFSLSLLLLFVCYYCLLFC